MDPQGNLSDYFDVPADASPTVAEVLAGSAKAADAIHDGVLPANLGLAEAELVLAGKMGRELTLKRALARPPPPLRPDPDRLPAGARAPDRERARGRRPRADLDRGRVLLAPGRRAGARGDRAGEGVAPPGPRLARRGAEHRRHAAGARARGAGPAEGALRREGVRDGGAAQRRATPSRPSAASRSSTTRPTWAPTTSLWPRRSWAGWAGSTTRRGASWPLSRLPEPGRPAVLPRHPGHRRSAASS